MPATATQKPVHRDQPDQPVLEIDNISVQFGSQEVLRDIALEIPAGQTLVVLGESGCGKTVLLKTLIGLVRPTRGEIRFEGHALGGMSERQLATIRTRYGFVFQSAALFDSLTIADNIAFPLREHTRIGEAEIASPRWACRGRPPARSRYNSPAACASGPAWPAPSRSTRRWCSTTSRPPASIRS